MRHNTAGIHTPSEGAHTIFDCWDFCKEALKDTIPAPFFKTFINPIQVEPNVNGENDSLVLYVQDEKLHRHIEDRYKPIIESALRDVHFYGQVSLLTMKGNGTGIYIEENKGKEIGKIKNRSICVDFIPNPKNQKEIEQLQKLSFICPAAYVFGPTGSGKTTLVKNLARSIETGDNLSARYLTLETFLTEFSLACRAKETILWRNKLRDNHLLIIDDFQFIKKSAKKSQEELRYLIDDFQEKGKKLILCSDTSLNDLPLQEDLLSRLRTAFPLPLTWPDHNGRTQILTGELKRLGLHVDHAVIEYISSKISGDIRKIESAAMRLKHYGFMNEKHFPGGDMLDNLLEDLYTRRSEISPQEVLEKTAKFYRVHQDAITGPARNRKYVEARHLCAYLCYELIDMNLSEVADFIGRRDHASVIHARKKVLDLMEKDLFFKKQVENLIDEIDPLH